MNCGAMGERVGVGRNSQGPPAGVAGWGKDSGFEIDRTGVEMMTSALTQPVTLWNAELLSHAEWG